MKTLLRTALATGLALGMTAGAQAASAVLDFEGIAPYPNDNKTLIKDFYDGGTSSLGTAGTNFGVSFGADATLLCLNSIGVNCSNASRGGLGNPASAQGALSFAKGGINYLNVAAGFESAIAFAYANKIEVGSVGIYSGLNGSGALLATLGLPADAVGCDAYLADFCPFKSAVLSFAGIAKSIGFESGTYQYAIDDLAFRNIGAVPEPASWAMMLAGFGILGSAMRGRRRGTPD